MPQVKIYLTAYTTVILEDHNEDDDINEVAKRAIIVATEIPADWKFEGVYDTVEEE